MFFVRLTFLDSLPIVYLKVFCLCKTHFGRLAHDVRPVIDQEEL